MLMEQNCMSNEELWYDSLRRLEEYIATNKKRPSQQSENPEAKFLAQWFSSQVTNYKNQTHIMKNPRFRKDWAEFISRYIMLTSIINALDR
jgi:hypothetical protein